MAEFETKLSMTSSNFYGSSSSSSSRLARRLLLAASRAETPLRLSRRRRPLNGDEEDYSLELAWTETQDSAIQMALADDEWSKGSLRVFSREFDSNGRRSFVACHPKAMWELITSWKPMRRHFYEVIPCGCRCKLYLDVEFTLTMEENRVRDGENALRRLIDRLCETLGCSPMNVLDLDSSTDQKFSHHLIFNVVFADNRAVGSFVRKFLHQVLSKEEREEDFSFLNKDGESKIFVDESVYSKNRNFRMFKCSKFGRSAVLRLSEWSRQFHDDLDDQQIFMKSLVTLLENDVIISDASSSETTEETAAHATSTKRLKSQAEMPPSTSWTSPFPEVDAAFAALIRPGRIRKVTFKACDMSVEYELSGYRMCSNVGRSHRSNNVKFVALLKKGVYVQLCHDPDCADYISPELPLPAPAIPWDLMLSEEESWPANLARSSQGDDFTVNDVENLPVVKEPFNQNHTSDAGCEVFLEQEEEEEKFLLEACEAT